jgi:RecB family exonuclease
LATGALLHRVLERFHTRWSDFSDGSVDVDGWTAQLLALREQLWEPNAFGTPLVATAAANAADIALRGYARALAKEVVARPFVVEQREVTVTVRVGRHELNGRVDRVDRAVDGMRTIVDYKKGAAKAESLESAMRDALELPKLAGTASSALTVQLPLYATVFDRVAAVAYVYLGGVHPVDRRDGAVVESTAIDEGTTRFTELLVAALQRELLDPLAARRLTTLPVAGSDDSCTFCPYARICPGPERR